MTLGHAKREARRLIAASDYPAALAAHHHLLRAVPQDLEVRLAASDLLARVGLQDEARAAYLAVGAQALATGRPLFAVIAALAARAAEGDAPARGDTQTLLSEIAARMAKGSRHVVRFAVRPAPPEDGQDLALAEGGSRPFEELADETLRLVLDGAAFAGFADSFHPVSLLSELAAPELLAVLDAAKLRRHGEGATVFRQGDAGESLFFVGNGQVRVFASVQGERGVEVLEHAQLHEGALFGEMALLTSQPRTASVAAIDEADLLEISRSALASVGERHPAVALVLDRYARERLIKNLLATSPLFTPFTRVQQAELLRRFEGVELAPGAEVIREGEAGRGLFILLSGELEVTSRGVSLARLHSGDVVGEMSLLGGGATTATVSAVTPGTALFLERGYFERLVTAIPEVRAYMQQLAADRAADRGAKLGRRLPSLVPPPPAATNDAEIPLGDDDLLLV